MSQDKKLRLVPPPGATPAGARPDEPPPTEAELAEAEALRDLLEEGREPISNSLRAAHAPPALSEPDHDALLARALGDVLAPPTRVEQADAAHLAGELGGKVQGEGSEHLQLARALRSASAPRPIDQVTHERILKKALGEAKSSARGSRIAMVSALFVAAAAVAMFFTTATRNADAPASEAVARAPAPAATAAAAAPRVERRSDRDEKVAAAPARARAGDGDHAKGLAAPSPRPFAEPPAGAPAAAAAEARPAAAHGDDLSAVAAYVPSRSTDDLFDRNEQFPKTGGESARIDRIAMARASDLRQNRFAAWGVR